MSFEPPTQMSVLSFSGHPQTLQTGSTSHRQKAVF